MKVYWCYYSVLGVRFFMAPSIRIIAISYAEAELAAVGRLKDKYESRQVTVYKVMEDKKDTKRLQFTLN